MRVRNMVVLAVVVAGVGLGAARRGPGRRRRGHARRARAGVGHWAARRLHASGPAKHETDDVIDIPLKDVVRWQGKVGSAQASATPPTAARSTAASSSSCRSASPA